MAWITLVVSGVLETVWVAALSQSRGFTRLVPSVEFGVALVLSMIGLAHALRTIPVGTGRRLVRHGLAGPLIAYRREFVGPRPYTLDGLAHAAGMSISGVRTTYGVGAAGFESATARV